MFSITSKGDWHRTDRFFKNALSVRYLQILERYAREGCAALMSATPKDTGITADSWSYRISRTNNAFSIIWENSNVVDGVPIVIILQYGHGTGNGGYVQGRDYINPAIKPVMDKIANEVWREVTKI